MAATDATRAYLAGDFPAALQVVDELLVRFPERLASFSQLRSEALAMLKEGIEAQYASTPDAPTKGRVARRKANYAAAIGGASAWKTRLDQRATV